LLASTHDRVTVSNAPYIFHSAVLVIWAHDVVYLGEWIAGSKIFLVEINSRFCNPEHHFIPQIFSKTLPHKNSLREIHSIIILINLVRAGADAVQVSANARSLLVFVHTHFLRRFKEVQKPLDTVPFENSQALFSGVVVSSFETVAYRPPFTGASYSEAHFSFQVRLVEDGKHSHAVESFEL